MKVSRRFAGLLIAVVVCTLLATVGLASAKTKLVIYGAATETESTWDKLFANFKKEHPGVEIEYHGIPSENFVERFMAAHLGGEQIDVLLLNGQDVRYFTKSGILMDLTGKVDYVRERLVEFARDVYTFGGHIYAVSVGGASTSGFFYNKAYWEKFGFTEPEYYSDLVEISNKLNAQGIFPLTHEGKVIYMWPMWFFETYGQTTHNQPVQRTYETLLGKKKFTDADVVEALEAIDQFRKDKIFMPGVNALDREAARAIFMTGKAALFYGGSWEIRGFRERSPEGFDFGAFLFPKLKPDYRPQPTGGAGMGCAIYSKIDPSRKELALDLIEYLSRDESVALLAEVERHAMTTSKNVPGSDDPIALEMGKDFLPQTKVFLDWIWPPEINNAFQVGIQAIVGGQKTPSQVAEAIQARFEELVAKGYEFMQ